MERSFHAAARWLKLGPLASARGGERAAGAAHKLAAGRRGGARAGDAGAPTATMALVSLRRVSGVSAGRSISGWGRRAVSPEAQAAAAKKKEEEAAVRAAQAQVQKAEGDRLLQQARERLAEGDTHGAALLRNRAVQEYRYGNIDATAVLSAFEMELKHANGADHAGETAASSPSDPAAFGQPAPQEASDLSPAAAAIEQERRDESGAPEMQTPKIAGDQAWRPPEEDAQQRYAKEP
jgi:hypothetical protein